MDDCSSQTGRRSEYKSCAERQIGEFLHSRRLPFIYEKPTAVIDDGKVRIWYPDYSLQCGLLIEYFGVCGDRGYLLSTRHKLRVYRENQLDVIALYPPDMIPRWRLNLLRRIEEALHRRLLDVRR